MNKLVLSIQDISCVGQCSTTVALPIISACGVECGILPSAVLSTHTGGKFRDSGYTFHDISPEFGKIEEKWNQAGIKFDVIYTGYLGTGTMIDQVLHIKDTCLKDGGLLITDPAMADGGKLYPGFDENYVEAMKKLCSKADVILPNISEACLLTGQEYRESYAEGYIRNLCYKLEAMGCKRIIITGVSLAEGQTGAAVYDKGEFKHFAHKLLPQSYHGTGDIFASVFAGAVTRGLDDYTAAGLAATFTMGSIERTMGDEDHWYGVKFEGALGDLPMAIQTILTKKKEAEKA